MDLQDQSKILQKIPPFAENESLGTTNASLIALTNTTELVSFVESAVTYAKENGKEKALKEFNNKSGQFVDGELYIFASDFNGTVLATLKSHWIGQKKSNIYLIPTAFHSSSTRSTL